MGASSRRQASHGPGDAGEALVPPPSPESPRLDGSTRGTGLGLEAGRVAVLWLASPPPCLPPLRRPRPRPASAGAPRGRARARLPRAEAAWRADRARRGTPRARGRARSCLCGERGRWGGRASWPSGPRLHPQPEAEPRPEARVQVKGPPELAGLGRGAATRPVAARAIDEREAGRRTRRLGGRKGSFCGGGRARCWRGPSRVGSPAGRGPFVGGGRVRWNGGEGHAHPIAQTREGPGVGSLP